MPTVCKIELDAKSYSEELKRVVAETHDAMSKIGKAGSQSEKGIGQAKESIEALGDAAQKTEKAAETMNHSFSVAGNADELSSKIEQVGESLETITIPAESLKDKAKSVFKSLREEMNNTSGGAKKLFSALAGGGAVGIILAGIGSIIKVIGLAKDNVIAALKEAGEAEERQVASSEKVREVQEQKAQAADGYLQKLKELSSVEKLSASEMQQAESYIQNLTAAYGNLGIHVDAATGKIYGLSSALKMKQRMDLDRRISELTREKGNLHSAAEVQGKIVEEAGYSAGRRKYSLGGEAEMMAAAQKRDELLEKENDKTRQINALKLQRAALDKDALTQAKIEVENLEKERRIRNEQKKEAQTEWKFAQAQTAEEKILIRKQQIKDASDNKLKPLEAKTDAAWEKVVSSKGLDKAEAEKNMLALIREQDEVLAKIENWQRSIKELEAQREKQLRTIHTSLQQEKEIQSLILAGDFEKAEALKLERELKNQNLKLSEEEKKKILEQRAALASMDTQKMIADAKEQVALQELLLKGQYDACEAEKLRIEMKAKGRTLTKEETDEILKQRAALASGKLKVSQKSKVEDLYSKALAFSDPKAAAQYDALRQARAAKGSELTQSERDLTLRIADLTRSLDTASTSSAQLGDLTIKTNSLTARGGLQGKAVMPDKDQVNRAISTNTKRTAEIQQKILTLLQGIL